jgi:D-tagatose-1,6-bisphosphate aldolase subunit GatZ/KbaZ
MISLPELVRRHKSGEPIGVYSVCTAHPLVIEATLRHVQRRSGIALIEATSNQVNQDGGYTGLKPQDFYANVLDLCRRIGFPRERLVLGGDHLGPNAWQHVTAQEALAKARVLVTQYVRAGFRKIHLDCSMACADDAEPLCDATIAARAADLAATAEAAWHEAGGDAPHYVIGTEVPVPGGAQEQLHELAVTTPQAAAATLEAQRSALATRNLEAIWPRIIGLVVQPGVEFDHQRVVDYQPDKAAALSRFIETMPTLLYEAHSTDYQSAAALEALVRDHFAILKVGPALTFALREALWALDRIEHEWLGAERASNLRATVARVMRADPRHWQKHYHSQGARLEFDLEYSLSDRIRYYWPHRDVNAAFSRLLANLDADPPPLALVSQYLPSEYLAIREGRINARGRDLIMHRIDTVLETYSSACTNAEM